MEKVAAELRAYSGRTVSHSPGFSSPKQDWTLKLCPHLKMAALVLVGVRATTGQFSS